MQIDTYIPVTKAKTELPDIIQHIDDQDDTIAITKNGIPKVVIMSMLQYEAMRETMTIMANEDMMKQVRSSTKKVRVGRTLLVLEDI